MRLRLSIQLALLVVTLFAAMTSRSEAQRPEGRRGRGLGRDISGVMLLAQKAVQDELKLTEDQLGKAKTLGEEQASAMRTAFQAGEAEREEAVKKARAAASDAVAKILTADQAKRLEQIRLQARGIQAFASEEIAKALSLTDDQKKEVTKIDEARATELQGLFQNRGDGAREEARKKVADANRAATEKAQALLTAEQKTKWSELVGAPFKGELSFGPPGGGPGGGRRRPQQ